MDWFRSYHGAPVDPKWTVIARRAEVPPVFVVALWWSLMDYASQHEDRGSIAGFDTETAACFLGIEEEEVERVLAALKDKGLVANDRLTAWEKRQPKREDSSASRMRRLRERQKESVTDASDDDVTESDADVTQGDASDRAVTPDERRVEKREEKREKPKGASKRRADRAAPWMAEVRPVYRERYDADPPARVVKELRPAIEEHGVEEVIRRFRVYCARTEGRFFDAGRFVATWADWDGSPPRVEPPPDPGPDEAEALFATLRDNGLIDLGRDAFHSTVARLVTEGAIRDGDRFLAQCRLLNFRDLRQVSADRFAIAHIRERLAAAGASNEGTKVTHLAGVAQ